ncbi:uncharacterized protein LY79DRAFT_71690 [Colletotrichum navitas]|uniref:Uncharacterized protein n=1 Tax=Colletotrichum navitas TaxID=681940 RepID=A0AAD8PKR2_9PEZI|nr:uncharacterized protein LY79DRAFT_71690 [Colletotrichum navitas]KAK1569638.1 hypothetical protein LY79DRAFT_71690 [Colletotrichum navitas]
MQYESAPWPRTSTTCLKRLAAAPDEIHQRCTLLAAHRLNHHLLRWRVLVTDIDGEVAALKAEAAELESVKQQQRRPPNNDFDVGNPGGNDRERPRGRSREALEPQDDEERQFLEPLRQGSQALSQAAINPLISAFGQRPSSPPQRRRPHSGPCRK